jgi:hypothetical protein
VKILHCYSAGSNAFARYPRKAECLQNPPELVAKYKKHYVAGLAFCFERGSGNEHKFLEDIKSLHVPFSLRMSGAWDPKNIDAFRFYRLSIQGWAGQYRYDAPATFADHESCGFPIPDALCGFNKQQIRKFQVPKSFKFHKADFFSIAPNLRLNNCDDICVSKRLRDALVAMDVTGVKFFPILHQAISWSDEEAMLDTFTTRMKDLVTHYQMKVTGRTTPEQIDMDANEIERCTVCAVARLKESNGYLPNIFAVNALQDLDFQAHQLVKTRDGVEMNQMAPYEKVFVSARVVKMMFESDFRGWSTATWFSGKLDPVLIEGEF